MNAPLAERMRPRTLDDYIGQRHLVGEGAVLRRMIESGRITSFILWGPPGVGKTTLAQIIAHKLETPFYTLSAVTSGVKDVRDVIERARNNRFFNQASPILFIDEIHRFSKSQQDSLLGAVEKGTVTLIGATTENPSFEVIRPLLSRCQLYVLKSLEKDDLLQLLHRALTQDVELSKRSIRLEETGAMLRYSGGDARKLLNAIELAVMTTDRRQDGTVVIDLTTAEDCIQRRAVHYDKNGDQHYDTISAFIKSMRGSDPDAAVYYLAKMLEAGEDIRFIARRIMICASEDVGNADPMAMVVAASAAQEVERIGLPESQLILSQAAIYVACAPKSNACTEAVFAARRSVREVKTTVPVHLQDAHYAGHDSLGHGIGYLYAHDFPNHYVRQQYLPDEIRDAVFYEPTEMGYEAKIRTRLAFLKEHADEKKPV